MDIKAPNYISLSLFMSDRNKATKFTNRRTARKNRFHKIANETLKK